jgi:hypothetical protein
MAIELLQAFSVQSTHQWHDIVTLDESWIFLFSEHDLMWTAPGEIVVDRERQTVESLKFMLTVVWNLTCFYVLKTLPKGRKFNAQYYIIIQMISCRNLILEAQTRGTRPNKLWVHSDNARPHTAKMSRDYVGLNRTKRTPHSPIPQIWHPRTFPFWGSQRKADGQLEFIANWIHPTPPAWNVIPSIEDIGCE